MNPYELDAEGRILLRETLLEIVDTQLKEHNPPAVEKTYDRLLELGFTSRVAKEKLAEIVLKKIYDALKEGKSYDEAVYTKALDKLVEEYGAFNAVVGLEPRWDECRSFVNEGELYTLALDYKKLVKVWWEAWDILKQIIGEKKGKVSVSDLLEATDYDFAVDAFLQDFEMELGNAGEHAKRIEFCRQVLEWLDWKYEDDSNFNAAIGEALYASGRFEEGQRWFKDCLKKDPGNANLLNVFSLCAEDRDGADEAYQIIREKVIGIPCTMFNELLFYRAKDLAERLQRTEDLEWIDAQLDAYRKELDQRMGLNDIYDTLRIPVQKPVVKGKKIYPNDPCPCGSGKKYKKCCGRK